MNDTNSTAGLNRTRNIRPAADQMRLQSECAIMPIRKIKFKLFLKFVLSICTNSYYNNNVSFTNFLSQKQIKQKFRKFC